MRPAAKAAVIVGAVAWLGGCGTDAGRDGDAAVRDTVRQYFRAIGAHDGPKACASLTPVSRERIGELAAKLGRPRRSGCAGTMQAFFASGAMAQLEASSKHDIASIHRAGNHASVRVQGVAAPLSLRRTAGRWLIAFAPSVEADKLP